MNKSRKKTTLVMSRSDFVTNNLEHMDLAEIVKSDGRITLTETAQNFTYLYDYDIVNWDEIKHTIDIDSFEGNVDDDRCEVAFDWSKYEIKWED